jgi:hypothetical protein
MIFNIVIWSITAGWLASKVQSITSSRKTLPLPFCAIFEVEEHPVVNEAMTRQQQSIGAMARVTEEKMVIPVLLCQKQAGQDGESADRQREKALPNPQTHQSHTERQPSKQPHCNDGLEAEGGCLTLLSVLRLI